MSTSPRRLVVTGASTGIGRSVAVAARDRGWRVLGTVRKDADADALRAEGMAAAHLDLARPDAIAAGCAAILDWADGHLDGVVHNAGSTWPAPVELQALDELRLQFETNVFGHVDVTQRLLPAVRRARGRMVYVSSDSVTTTPPMVGAYAASKRAIEAIAEALAQEVADQGVVVSVVAPGPFQTAIWGTSTPRGQAYLEGEDPRLALYRPLAERIAKASTNRPLGDPADLARVVIHALDAPEPAFRYVSPWTSRAQGWIKALLGERRFHALVRREIARRGA